MVGSGAGYIPPSMAVETPRLIRPSETERPDNDNNDDDIFRLY